MFVKVGLSIDTWLMKTLINTCVLFVFVCSSMQFAGCTPCVCLFSLSLHLIYFRHPLIYFGQSLYGSYICTLMRASPPLSPVCFQQMSLSKKPKCHLLVTESFMSGHILRTGRCHSMKHQAVHIQQCILHY